MSIQDSVGVRPVSAGRIATPGTLRPETKITAILLFILAVALDGRIIGWRLGAYAGFLFVLMGVEHLNPVSVVRRSLFFLPFLAFAMLGRGTFRPDSGMWTMLARGCLSAVGLAVLGLSTRFSSLVAGLRRLGFPRVLAMMLALMYRYLDLLIEEARRMERARDLRFFGKQHLQQFSTLGKMIGSLFVRTYERGERVHTAMVLRGYEGVDSRPDRRAPYPTGDMLFLLASVVLFVGLTIGWVE